MLSSVVRQLYNLSSLIARKNMLTGRLGRECDVYISNFKQLDMLNEYYHNYNYVGADLFSFIF